MYPKQLAAIFEPKDFNGNPARFSFIEAGTKTGKTVGCISWLFEQALLAKKRNQNYWWIAPVYPQAEIAFKRMLEAFPKRTFHATQNPPMLKLAIAKEATISFKSGEKPDNLYGEDVYGAVFDEASRSREEAWTALRSTLTATRAPARMIGNVRGRQNWFYKMARLAEKGEPDFSYHRIVANDAVKAGVLEADEIESARRQMTENAFKELFLAEPSDDGGNPFGYKHVLNCIGTLSTLPPVAWGIDIAKHVDWTVCIGLDVNGNVCRFERFQAPWDATINRIISIVGRIPALIDSTGVGDPVLEMLQKDGRTNFEGFNFSSASKQKLMEGLAVAIQGNAIRYPDGPIRIELESFEYEYTRTGVRYGAPEGEHDDCVCSLALAVMHKSHAKRPMLISDAAIARMGR